MNSPRYFLREQIEANQQARLRELLSALVPENPFCTEKLRGAGIGKDALTLEDFKSDVPFTRKQELVGDQRSRPPYGSNLTFPVERYIRLCQSSATGGTPLRWLDTRESWNWMLGCWKQVFAVTGVTAHDRTFFASSFAPFLGFWTAFEAASQLGCLCIPGGGLTSLARVSMILDNQVTVVCCTPTYALRMAEAAEEEGIDLARSRVEKIVVAGEPGGSLPAVRERIETLWQGARVFDHHGMTEIGPVSYPCPSRRDTLHVLESDYIAEIVDPETGAPAPAGSTGELVLTNLGRVGSPLLRYRTGDLVKSAHQQLCECGSWELALEGGILSRSDDMVVVRGVNLYPSAIEEIIRACGGIGEYRVEIDARRALPQIRLQVEASGGNLGTEAVVSRLEKRLHRTFGLRIPVEAVPAGTLPRFEMKARRWIRS